MQMKDIQVVNLSNLDYKQEKFAIVCSGFSSRHLFSTAKKLKTEVNALGVSDASNRLTT